MLKYKYKDTIYIAVTDWVGHMVESVCMLEKISYQAFSYKTPIHTVTQLSWKSSSLI